MFKLLIADDEGKTTVVPLVRDEVTIGRKEGNTIRLTERNVSRKHAKLRRANGVFFVSDLKSYNGVRVNGRRIEGEVELKSGDQVVIGDYQLSLQFEGAAVEVDTGPTTTAPMAIQPENEGPTALVSAPPSLEPSPPARLVMVSPPAPGAEFALSRPRLRIGRAEDLEIWVNHRSISREHAEIAVEDGGVFIRDLASANGVRVNGVDTKQGPVRPGDVIELGQVRFRMVAAGEYFHFDADRTIQMDALSAAPAPNRMPLFIAAGIVAVALVVGAGVAMSGGGGGTPEPQVTAIATSVGPGETPPPVAAGTGADLDAQIAAAVAACQMALSSGNFPTAIARANEALALRPGDPQASACHDNATRAASEDAVFLAGQAALRQSDLASAVASFQQLPEGSPYLSRPEVGEAYAGYAQDLLSQARAARDPVVAGGLADQVLGLPGLDRAVVRDAEAISRRAATPTAVAVARPDRPVGRPGPGPDRPVRGTTPVERPPPQPPAAAVTPPSGGGPSPEDEARVCLANGDNACVIRVLGGGRARTARQLAMLAQAQRSLTGPPSACPTVRRLLDQFGSSPEAGRYRAFDVSVCQGH